MTRATPAISSEQIAAELQHRGLLPDAACILRLRPGNPDRNDFPDRANYEVLQTGRPVMHLTVGPELGSLHERSLAFAAACPAISCPVLLRHRTQAWEAIGYEYFPGRPLEELMASGDITAATVHRLVDQLAASLEKTRLPARRQDAAAELEGLFHAVESLPGFDSFDRSFLREAMFPWMQSGALAEPCSSRWTNGDLIPANILVTPDGEFRLIDYEFAGRTHFPAEDWWRWDHFSGRPAPSRPSTDRAGPWLEAYGRLRQMVLAHRAYVPHLAAPHRLLGLEALLALLAADSDGFRPGMILPLLAKFRWASPALPTGARLYWHSAASRTETASPWIAYPGRTRTTVRFELGRPAGILSLRLHPSSAPGTVRLHRVVLRAQDGSEPLLLRDAGTGWEGLALTGITGSPDEGSILTLRSQGSHSHLSLPQTELRGETGNLLVEVELELQDDATNPPQPAQPAAPAGG